jgi:hypothetical protein
MWHTLVSHMYCNWWCELPPHLNVVGRREKEIFLYSVRFVSVRVIQVDLSVVHIFFFRKSTAFDRLLLLSTYALIFYQKLFFTNLCLHSNTQLLSDRWTRWKIGASNYFCFFNFLMTARTIKLSKHSPKGIFILVSHLFIDSILLKKNLMERVLMRVFFCCCLFELFLLFWLCCVVCAWLID